VVIPFQNFLTQVGSIWFGFVKFPLKMSNFSIFSPSDQRNLFESGQKVPGSKSTLVKGGSASYILVVKSKLGSGQGPSLVRNQRTISLVPGFIHLFPQECAEFRDRTLPNPSILLTSSKKEA